MTDNSNVIIIDGGPLGRPGPINDLRQITRETARLYRAGANGRIDLADMAKGIWALQCLSRMVIDAEFEDRIDQLERTVSHVDI
jgi:hypothetical protein